jgi:hypothetical protein
MAARASDRLWSNLRIGMVQVTPNELKRAVEAQHGSTATLVQSVPILERTRLHTADGTREVTVWEGVVHVFDLADHPKATRAYAWSSERDDGKRRFYAVLHMGPINGPADAVRAAIMADRRAQK